MRKVLLLLSVAAVLLTSATSVEAWPVRPWPTRYRYNAYYGPYYSPYQYQYQYRYGPRPLAPAPVVPAPVAPVPVAPVPVVPGGIEIDAGPARIDVIP